MPEDLEDYYALLDLDPSVQDWPSIEKRIREKKEEWARNRSQGNPKARRKAKRAFDQLPEMEAALRDEKTRRRVAKAAEERRRQVVKQAFVDLDAAIDVLGTVCEESQLDHLFRDFDQILSEDQIRQRLRARGIELGSNRKERIAKPQLDPSLHKKIRKELEHLGYENLYAFLKMRPQSSPRSLSDKAAETDREIRQLGKHDDDTTAKRNLVTFSKQIFRDQGTKETYDNTLADESMESLERNIKLAGSDKYITRDEMDALVRQARKRGVSAEDARVYIEDYAARCKWGVQSDAELPSDKLRSCGFCAALAPAEAKRCTQCGEALDLSCPRCGTRNPTSNAACGQCGCLVGDAPRVQGLLEEGKQRLLEGAPGEALRCFDQALLYWPDWAPAKAAQRDAKGRQEERENALAVLEKEVSGRCLTAAQTTLGRFERQHGKAGLEALRRRIQEGTERARKAFRQGEARRQADDGEGALDRYEEALAACVDFEPARRALAQNPPPSPGDLKVQPLSGGFRLRWGAADSRRPLEYRVLRKKGGSPRDAEDGTVVGEVGSATLDDVQVPAGHPSYYAVFSQRRGVPSRVPAVSGPHLLTAEVVDLEAVPGDCEVSLRWTRPPGCRRVTVWRSIGDAPKGVGTGREVPVGGDSVRDTGLRNGEQYGYLVVAHYPDPRQPTAEIDSRGETASLTPMAPPSAVKDLQASRRGKTVLFSFTPVPGAQIQIRGSHRSPPSKPGQILPLAQLAAFGPPLVNTSPGSAQAELDGQGRMFFVPFTVLAGTAVAGRAVEVIHLDPVTGLGARRVGSDIVLTWGWPAGCDEVVVRYAHDAYLEDARAGSGTLTRVTQLEYERAGCFILRRVVARPHYITVFARAQGGDLFAPAVRVVESMGQGIEVNYEVVVKKAFLRRSISDAWLELVCRDSTTLHLPELIVMGKARNLPLSPRDGELLAEVPGLSLKEGRARIPLPQGCFRHQPYVKVFFKDAARAQEVRLLPAVKERLRVA